MTKIPSNIIISRIDSIGDVVLTLPIAAIVKENFPGIKVAFMGNTYTQPVIQACKNIDAFIDVNDFLKNKIFVCGEKPQAILHVLPVAKIAVRALQLKIPLRIGTSRRVYHWLTCNKLVTVKRKNSALHEAQLNIKLLQPLGIKQEYSLKKIREAFGLEKVLPLPEKFSSLIKKNKYKIILHPKSQGSAREWGLDNFIHLIRLLDKNKFQIFISGVKKEREMLQPVFDAVGNDVTDITGLMSLEAFMSFINNCDGLVAASTGPLHIAAALGKNAFGIYPPIRPMHPGRWAPLGVNAKVFVTDRECSDCRKNPESCYCIHEINATMIARAIENAFK